VPSSKVLENLTRSQYVGLALAGVVVVVAGYFVVKKIISDVGSGVKNLGKAAADAVTSTADQAGELLVAAPDATGESFVKWYDPTQRTVFFYWIPFPDGTHHIVGAGSVQSDGTFDYNGTQYRIGYDKVGDLRAYAYDPSGIDFGVTGGGW
jgi:hypothetical protein